MVIITILLCIGFVFIAFEIKKAPLMAEEEKIFCDYCDNTAEVHVNNQIFLCHSCKEKYAEKDVKYEKIIPTKDDSDNHSSVVMDA